MYATSATLETMVVLIVGMLLCVVLALAVVALVAIPARREGREVLTAEGEELVAMAKERTQDALDKTGEAIVATKDKVSESIANSASKEPATAPEGGSASSASPATATSTSSSAATPAGRAAGDTTARRAS
jgi:sensor histidine kinase regulating citrate/malate metabolism